MITTALALSGLATYPLYIGTYTSPAGSKGIYNATLDAATGQLSEASLVAEIANPSYLARTGTELLAVTEWGGPDDLTSFTIQPDGQLSRNWAAKAGGGGPCHISVHASGKLAALSAYGGGTVTLFDLASRSIKATFQNTGTGPNPARQEKPHMHFAAWHPQAADRLYACDLGTDEVLQFGSELTGVSRSKVPAGGGARHLAFHPEGKVLFVGNEMTSAVSTFSVDPRTGNVTLRGTVPTLDSPVDGNSTAAVKVHPNGKWLYVSNRGHNSIAVFQIQANGELQRTQIQATGVAIPRDFSVDPSGKWMVVAGQDSNDLVTLPIQPETGKLGAVTSRIKVNRPVCVLF